MSYYRHILLALDLHDQDDTIIQTVATSMQQLSNATLSLIHAVPHINSYGASFVYPDIAEVQEKLVEEARTRVAAIAEKLDVSTDNQHVEIGWPRTTILDCAKRIGADLLIVGSHHHHGLQMIMGSIANSLAHEAPCDLLTVRIPDKKNTSCCASSS